MQSPNYSAGSSGWQIRKDGSAEFNNLTIRGTFQGTNFIINSSGIFLYSPSEALGNLIGSWSSAAGTDSFGNAYPKGLNVATGSISGTTISGSTITGTTFDGTNFILNSSGMFFYNGTPASGNLVGSMSPTSVTQGTDGFGNTYYGGMVVYDFGGQPTTQAVYQLANGGLNIGLPNQFGNSPTGLPASLVLGSLGVGGEDIFLAGGDHNNTDIASSIELLSQFASGITNGEMVLRAGRIVFGATTSAIYDDQASPPQFNVGAGGGPFVSGETFHTVSLAAGLTGLLGGGVGCRVKLLPWNGIWLDFACTFNYSGSSQTFTLGSLPSASYYPTTTRQFALSIGGTPSGITSVFPRIQVGTSGALSVFVPSGTGSTINLMGSFMYPTN